MAEQASRTAPSEDHCCAVCYHVHDTMQKCSRCLGATYCSKDCQLVDWPLHKLLCQQFAETKNPEAAADGSIPGGGRGQYRRSIFFHPDEAKPQIVWVKITSLDLALMQHGKGTTYPVPGRDPDKFYAATMVVAAPWQYHVPSTATAEEKVRATARGAALQRKLMAANQHTVTKTEGLIVGYRSPYGMTASTANMSLSNTVRASGDEPESVWKGPFVFRRPKEAGNIDLNDFRHLVRHVHLSPALLFGTRFDPGMRNLGNLYACTLRLCPRHPRCRIRNSDGGVHIQHAEDEPLFIGGTLNHHRNVGMEDVDPE